LEFVCLGLAEGGAMLLGRGGRRIKSEEVVAAALWATGVSNCY